jgi:hypothetical protein
MRAPEFLWHKYGTKMSPLRVEKDEAIQELNSRT